MTAEQGQPPPGEELRLHGVSLRQCAAVHAAIAEPFALKRVLALEEIDYQTWRRADIDWKKRVVRGPDFEHYRTELAAAEDWLLRIVSPLHQDVEAWTTFLSAFARAPADVLRGVNLGLNDVSRLSRFWATQMARDSLLESRFADLMKRGPGAWPHVTADPKHLRRSCAFHPGPAAAAPAVVTPPEPEAEVASIGLERYAALRAELAVTPKDARRILDKYELGSEAAALELEHLWEARFHEEPALQRDYRVLYAHFEHQARVTAQGAHDEPSSRASHAVSSQRWGPAPGAAAEGAPHDPRGTVAFSAFAAAPALPFGPASERSPLSRPQPTEPAPSAPADAGATAVFSIAMVSSTALPFGPGSERAPQPHTEPPSPPPDAPDDPGGTAVFSVRSLAAALPFAPRSEARPPVPSTRRAVAPTRIDEAMASTPALPFHPHAEPPSAGTPSEGGLHLEQYASLCVELRRRPDRAAETLARYHLSPEHAAVADAHWKARIAGDPALYAAFQHAYEAYEAWLTAPPSVRSQPPAPVSVLPELPSFSVEQYASLTTDLALAPARRAETLLRYRLTEAQRALVDGAWARRFAQEPAAEAAFQRASATYRAWLARRGR